MTIDGGEGGTGAAPLVFADSVVAAVPGRLQPGLRRVRWRRHHRRVTFVGAGKLGLPDNAIVALALGCDMVNVAREAMFAVGCIQAQKCHTGHCPTGVATQDPWLSRGLDPESKAVRVANYVKTLQRDLLKVAESCGVAHPALVDVDDVEVLYGTNSARRCERSTATATVGRLSSAQEDEISALMTAAPHGGSRPAS